MITIAIYNPTYKNNWNEFVKNSKNATFMFQRDYMEYHSERFQDLSLMFYNDEKLVAIMPCSFNDNQIVSHAGLSFGGILSTYKMTVSIMLECFEALTTFMKNKSIKSLIYKCIPNIYHLYPSQEDLYALFINHAKLIRRDIASVIYLPEKIKFSKGKKWGISKAKQFGVEVKQFYDFAMFINYENVILHQKYGTTDAVNIAKDNFIGMGAIINKNTDENKIYSGCSAEVSKITAKKFCRVKE